MEDLQNPLLHTSSRRSCFNFNNATKLSCLAFSALFSLALLIFLIHKSQCKAPESHVNSVSIFTNSSDAKSGHWDALLSLNNPLFDDADDISHEARSWLYYKDRFLSTTRVTRFVRDLSHRELVVHAEFDMKPGMEYGSGIDGVGEDFARDGALSGFDLLVEANVTYKSSSWFEKRSLFLMVDCTDLKIEFDTRRLLGGVERCQIRSFASKSDAVCKS